MKLGRKDYTISVKTGTDANKAKFKKECVQGEIYHATDTGFFYIAEVTAGASDATLSKFGTPAFQNLKSVSFDGSDDYCDITGASGVFNNATSFSISLWYYARANGGAVFGCGTSGTNGVWILPYDSTNLYLSIRNGQGNSVNASNPGLNKWVHVVATYNSGASIIYVTPKGASTSTYSGTLDTSLSSTAGTDLSIGRLAAGFNFEFNGLIDEVALWDSVLTSSNVTAIYNSGTPNDISSLNPVGWWRMGDGTEAGSGTTIYDMSSNSNNGTLTNGPTFSTTVPS